MLKSKGLLVLAAVLALFAGCASEPLLKPELPIVFPRAPETPRIVYERSYRGSIDFRTVNFFDKLFGTSVSLDLEKPFDVFAQNNKIYITDTGRGAVQIIDLTEKNISRLGGREGKFRLGLPLGIRGTADGRIYVADGSLKTVEVFDDTGAHVQSIGKGGGLNNPAGIAIDPALGRLYVADSKSHAIKVFKTTGEYLSEFGERGETEGKFLFPSFVAVDPKTSEVYVSDTNNFRVQVFDKDGKFVRAFGELGDAPGFFQRPKGIGLDSEGHVYVVEAVFNNFQLFDEKGQVLMWVGNGGSGRGGLFMSPAGLYIDENDKVYVVDSLNKRIQVYQYLSEKWKKDHPEEYNKYLNK
jgi:DNA-binding beta-propeller fold protein YncE